MGSVGLFFSLTALAISSFVFFTIYTYEQYSHQKIVEDIGWWFDKVVASAAVIIVVIVFIYDQRSNNYRRIEDNIQEKVRICNSIIRELDDHERAYYGNIHTQTLNDDDGILFTNAVLDTNAFLSISRSGLFTHFKSETQNQLSNMYLRVSEFNSESDYRFKLQDMYQFGFKTPDSKQYYEDRLKNIELQLTLLEAEIKDYLPVVRKMIEDEKTMR